MDSQWYDELLNKVDLVGLIGKYVRLTKKGNKFWGCCPFHHETQPSFTVTPDKNFYYCFGCKESGNAITFLSKIESISKQEALETLCNMTGTPLPGYDKVNDAKNAEILKKKDKLYELMKVAARHYHENLYSPAAQAAVEYLKKREIDRSLAIKFGMGYSINGREMLDYLKKQGYTYAQMKEAGIAEQSADDYYDVFFGRLMIPIIDNRGRVIAFGGRTLSPDAKFAKYRNSAQTLIFDKSRTVFGINLLKKKKQTSDIKYCIMTEGYMDAISLHKAGFDTAVASMGTSLTFEQAKILKNYSTNIYISYDGDGAGQKATLRGLDILASTGFNVKVVCLPDGMDPDDVIKQKGRDFYAGLLKNAVTLTEFKLSNLLKNYDLGEPDGKSRYAYEAIKIIKKLPTLIEQEEYLKIVSGYTGYPMEILRKQADIIPEEKTDVSPPPVVHTAKDKEGAPGETAFILASMLAQKPFVDYGEELFEYITDDFYRLLYSAVIDAYRRDNLNCGVIFEDIPDNYKDRFAALTEYVFRPGDDATKYRICINKLKTDFIEKQKAEIAEEYKKTKDGSLLKRLQQLDNKLKLMKKGGGHNV